MRFIKRENAERIVILFLYLFSINRAGELSIFKKTDFVDPVNKIGFQLIFSELDLDSHTKAFGISYYPTTNWEVFLNANIYKEKIKCETDHLVFYPVPNFVSNSNHVDIALGIKMHFQQKKRVSPYCGLMIGGMVPWRKFYTDYIIITESESRQFYSNMDTYRIQLGAKFPLGVTWWIRNCISLDISNQLGITYDYQSIKYYNKDNASRSTRKDQSTTWEYGLIDFRFICSFYYDL
ncbi:MAG: hypothetical protein KBA26_12825 [Candidatus Delongbacteria bacterium]|nr:hypothetical protein [Candidatus Delongbacteria bacterium]